jgi:hypothetical protein
MINELNAAINDYQLKWRTLAGTRKDRGFFDGLRPTAVGWKAVDPADFDKRFAFLRALSDQIHLGWVNERWLATFHLREPQLPWGIETIKLMQRRPGSGDATGLDHLDFLVPEGTTAAIIKTSEPDLKVTEEKNGDHCKWLSLWFGNTEAKLRSDTVFDVCASELLDTKLRSLETPGSPAPARASA